MSAEDKKSISGTALKRVVINYIPRQFLKDVDMSKLGFENSKLIKDGGVDILQKLLDKSNNELRMYGTGKELAEDLHMYRTFPSSHKKLGIDISEEYNTSPIPYLNQKNGRFFCKQDLFTCLHENVLSMLPKNTHQLTRSMIVIFLKANEEKVSGCLEFVKYKQKVIDQILMEITQTMTKIKNTKHTLKSPKSSFDEIFEEWKSLLPDWTEEKYEHVQKALQTHFKSYPLGKFHEIYSEIFSNIKILIEMLRNIINRRPEMYLPYSETNSQNVTAAVRVFEDCNQQFVMKSELYKAINITNPNLKPLKYEDEKGYLCAMEMDEVYENYGNQIKKIEFVHAVILRTNHMAVPIMTPSGDYCILAMNAFSHILRRLVHATRIFQKIKSDAWHLINDYIKLIIADIKFDMKCRYFVTLDVIEKLEEKTYEFFKSFENKPTKSIRDVRKVGFTVNYLKNELIQLGLANVFPDIEDFAFFVHRVVSEKKKRTYLRTCDLFEAVEHCQVNCFRQQFPGMDCFLHNQKACKTMIDYQCELCLSDTNDTSFSGTIWNEYNFSNVQLESFGEFNGETITHWYLKCPNGNQLISNFSFPSYLQGTNEFKYFILDRNDVEWLKDTAKNVKKFEGLLLNLGIFLTQHRNKRIYIRSFTTIPPKATQSKETIRVFTDEVLDIIPILLKQQGKSIADSDKKIEEYRTKWKNEKTFENVTINLAEFERVLEDINLDNNLITIVPDPHFMLSNSLMPTNKGRPNVLVKNSKGDWVMDSSQAVFHIFQSVVCNIDWTKEYCKTHKNCAEMFRKDIINAMRKYSEMNEGSYVLDEHVDESIRKLKHLCTYRFQSTFVTPLMYLESYKFDKKLKNSFIFSECDHYNVPHNCHPLSIIQNNEEHIPAWHARYVFLKVWMQMFFDDNDVELVKLIENALRFKFEEFLKTKNQKPVDIIPNEVSEKSSRANEELTADRLSEDAVAENSIGLLEITEKVENTGKSPEEAMENIKRMLKEDVTEDSNEIIQEDVLKYSCIFNIDLEKHKNEPDYLKSKIGQIFETVPNEFHDGPLNIQMKVLPLTEVDKMTQKSEESAQKNVPIIDKETEHAPIDLEISKKHPNIVDTSSDESIEKVEKNKEMEEVNTEDSNEIRERDELKNDSTLVIGSEKTEIESKFCEDCLQTNSILNETKKELETTRNERDIFEKKVEQVEKNLTTTTTILQETKQELENSKEKTTTAEKKSERIRENMEEKLKKKNEELEKIKKQLSEFSNCSKENETLKTKISKITENETKLKETNKKMVDARSQASKKVIELESQLKSEKHEKEGIRSKLKMEVEQNNQFLKRVHNLETQLKREKKKSQELEEKEVIQQKKLLEDNQMSIVIKESLENKISENQKVIARFTDAQFHLSKKVQQLEFQLESEKQKNTKSFETDQMVNDNQSNVEEDVSDNSKIIAELREENNNLSIRNKEQDRIYKFLFDKLISGSTTEAENSDAYLLQLVELQKIKDSFRQDIQLKHAKSMVEKLISLTDRSEIHQFANYELQQFEVKMRCFIQTVEMNIQNIMKTQNCDDMSPLPDLPKLSERFMTKYWNEVDKQPSTSSETSSELSDSECLICIHNMKTSDETLKCEHCRSRIHMECASDWFKVKRLCPMCNRSLLSPNEFPSLS